MFDRMTVDEVVAMAGGRTFRHSPLVTITHSLTQGHRFDSHFLGQTELADGLHIELQLMLSWSVS